MGVGVYDRSKATLGCRLKSMPGDDSRMFVLEEKDMITDCKWNCEERRDLAETLTSWCEKVAQNTLGIPEGTEGQISCVKLEILFFEW